MVWVEVWPPLGAPRRHSAYLSRGLVAVPVDSALGMLTTHPPLCVCLNKLVPGI